MNTEENKSTASKTTPSHVLNDLVGERVAVVGKLLGGIADNATRYGLSLGRIALQHSQKSLEATAAFLGELAAKVPAKGEDKTDTTTPKS